MNQHILDYLLYYAKLAHPPHFAVMLNGKWGTGKTFLAKQFQGLAEKEGLKCIYISLYGLQSAEEIDDALFRSMHNLLETRTAKLTGHAFKAITKNLIADIDLKIGDFLDKANADVFIFDDIERCKISTDTVLGYINEFIEHEGRKAVIVANENEIEDPNKYFRVREKVVGKTLEIAPDFNEATISFLSKIENEESRNFLLSRKDEIISIHTQSELNSLRCLQQTMWDFERFFAILTSVHKANKEAVEDLFQLFFVLSLELKNGRLGQDDLQNRHIAIMTSFMRDQGRDDSGPDPIVACQERYPSVQLDNMALSDQTLSDMLIRGIFSGEQVNDELSSSPYFTTAADEAAWRTVWHMLDRTEEEVADAIKKMEAAFDGREYSEPGEILHVFGMRLLLSTIGVLEFSRKEVLDDCKHYIDDQYKDKTLKPTDREEVTSELRFDGYGGLGIHESKSDDYRELYSYLQQYRKAAEADLLPQKGVQLLEDLTNETDYFVKQIIYTSEGSGTFEHIPILATIEPEKFVTALLDLHPSKQRSVFVALKERYSHGKLDRDLASEKDWLSCIRDKLIKSCENLSPLSTYRIKQHVRYSLDGPSET